MEFAEELTEGVARIILAYKKRVKQVLKRRSPQQRLKSRLYYRKHKAKIRLQRKKYLRKNKIFMKSRKLFKRTRPSWMTKKPRTGKPGGVKKPKIKKFKAPKRHK